MKWPWLKQSSEPTTEQLDELAKGITNNQEITKKKLNEVRTLVLKVALLQQEIDSLDEKRNGINPGGYRNVSEKTEKRLAPINSKRYLATLERDTLLEEIKRIGTEQLASGQSNSLRPGARTFSFQHR